MQASSTAETVTSMLRKTAANEGIFGLYRGMSAPLISVTPVFAVNFWGYEMGQRLVRFITENDNKPLSTMGLCGAGFLSAIPTTLIMAPSERIKCLLQMQQGHGEKKYTGMIDCAQKLYKQGGIRSIYNGTAATLLRDGPGSAAYFGVYETLKREYLKYSDTTSLSPPAVLTCGGLAGIATWTVCIPADVLKSRLQTAPEGMYNGIYDVFSKLIKEEGYSALFRGLKPALIRAFPANAACFMGVEFSRSFLTFLD